MSRGVLVLTIVLAACNRSASAPASGSGVAQPPQVSVVRVVSQTLHTTERLPAELAAWEAVAVFPKVRGFIAEIPVDRGSSVRRGQLLVRLSAPELIAQTAQAQAALEGDRATYQRLLDAAGTRGAVSANEIEVARQSVAGDQERVRSLETLADYLTIRAPFDGIVTERNVHPGALVGPPAEPLSNSVPMLRLEQTTHLRLTVPVPEADAGAVAEGAKVKFQVRAWPAREFVGTISRVSHRVDANTRTMAVEADVYDNSRVLDPGMFAEVLWPVERKEPSLLVPASAVVETPESVFVESVRADRLHRVPVQRGKSIGDMLEIFGALKAGDLVISPGSEDLADGMQVIARQSQS